jgi:Protein of unknown function (DUF3617)
MRRGIIFGLGLWFATAGWAADAITPLDVKLGLWEITHTTATSGQPPIPADMLAKMTPEQRAKFDQMMKQRAAQGPTTVTSKHCVTKEELNRSNMLGDDDKACTRTVIASTRSKLEAKVKCNREGSTQTGVYRVEAVDSGSVKGSMEMVMAGGDNKMTINSTFSGKWVGPACGSTK